MNSKYPLRSPNLSEASFFANNPKVGGYASFADNSVVLNPFTSLSPREQQSVRKNESIRLALNNNPALQGDFKLSNDQAARFGFYSPNIQDVRNTITARYLTNDKSAGDVTPEQSKHFSLLRLLFQ